MIFAGIDIGSRAAKAVVMENGTVVSSVICDTGPESVKTSYMAIEQALEGTGLSLEDIAYTVATGYGRVLVPFANENISEISCHARGINWYFPSVRTILDMGGQDCKGISCDGGGRVVNFVMNDKCAGGTGRFLEMIAEVLGLSLEEIGELSLSSEKAVPFNTICAVFARSEAITYLKKGMAKRDILAGLHEAIATRSVQLLKRVSIREEFSITGGIAKNRGMVAKLREKVGLEPLLCEDPQIVGALGAALFAAERGGGAGGKEAKVQYGYSDGTGEYFVTIDNGRCDGCGECVAACPHGVLEMAEDGSGGLKARVKDEVRKRLALVCPGFESCGRNEVNCHSACHQDAIGHTW
ncbi:MAG: acyl-CoA dehydratase activase [Chloroflexota bacterium]|nr:acyl-CoA dehydratase activase [Chloroflexota bacterium]